MTSIESRIRSAALADATLLSLLGDGASPPNFRWYNIQLKQGSAFPAVVMQLVAGVDAYAAGGRLVTGYSRYQFTCWDTNYARALQVETALVAFFATLDMVGNPGQIAYPNYIVMRRSGMQPLPDPPTYQRILDVNIFANDSL